MYKSQNLGNKSQELTNLKFSGLSVTYVSQESTVCVQMPIHSAWFFNNFVNDKLIEHGKT